MGEEAGYQSFVKVADRDGSNDFMELPREKDGSVLLSTVQGQFTGAIGLKYKSSSGGWRGIRAEDNVLQPPYGGWGETVYVVTESDALKRRSSREDGGHKEKRTKPSKLLDDLIVFGLPYTTTIEDFKEYFEETCGELAFYEVKVDRQTSRSRGFGFIRFKTEASAKEALSGYHEIQGRKLVVKVSEKKQNPIKLFVARIPRGATHEEVNDYFSAFGDLDDVFVPSGRGFAFITYASEQDGQGAIRMNHVFQGARLNVTIAEPRKERSQRDDRRDNRRDDQQDNRRDDRQDNRRDDRQDNRRDDRQDKRQDNRQHDRRGEAHDEHSNYTWKTSSDRSSERRVHERSNERYNKYSSDRRSDQNGDSDRRRDRSNDRHSTGGYNRNTSYEREDGHRSRHTQVSLQQKDLASELKNMLFTLLTSQK